MQPDSSRCQFVPFWIFSLCYLCLQENGLTDLTRAGGFLHGGTAPRLFSFPQAQAHLSLEPVKRFLQKYLGSGPGSSALSSIVLTSTRQCLEYIGSQTRSPIQFQG